jgi:ketosteroid isomerase-like protein
MQYRRGAMTAFTVAVVLLLVIAIAASCAPRGRVPADAGAPAASITAPAAATAASAPSAARAVLEQRQQAFFAAMAARDADGVAALFAEDGVMQVAGMPPIEGGAAVRQFYGNMFGFLSASTATPTTTVIAAAGDMAYGTGSTVNEFRGQDGPLRFSGKYALVWRQLGGEWRIVLYSISSNQQDAAR